MGLGWVEEDPVYFFATVGWHQLVFGDRLGGGGGPNDFPHAADRTFFA